MGTLYPDPEPLIAISPQNFFGGEEFWSMSTVAEGMQNIFKIYKKKKMQISKNDQKKS